MFKKLKERLKLKEALNISSSKEHISGLHEDVRSRLSAFRKNRSVEAQEELVQDFDKVLQAWGIAHENGIPIVIGELKLRCVVLAIPIVCSLFTAFFFQKLLAYLSLLFFLLPCLLGVLTAIWRMSVLENRQFIPFLYWLLPWRS